MTQPLIPTELPAIRTLLALQNQLGAAAPTFTPASVLELMQQLDVVSAAYPNIQSADFKSWSDQLYSLLAGADTVYQQKFTALYIAYALSQYSFLPAEETVSLSGYDTESFSFGTVVLPLQRVSITVAVTFNAMGAHTVEVPGTAWPNAVNRAGEIHNLAQEGIFPAFSGPFNVQYALYLGNETSPGWLVDGMLRSGAWSPPSSPAGWSTALQGLIKSWDSSKPPSNVIVISDFTNYAGNELAVLDPKSWKDVDRLRDAVAPVWSAQLTSLNSMMQPATLSSADYFVMLHLIIALASGPPDTQFRIANIANADCSSAENPNDVFVNQLVYLILMFLADPDGTFQLNNSQIQKFVADTLALVVYTGQASTTLKNALARQARILNSSEGYPMVDPYHPNVGFTQRVTDTLFALDQTRSTLRTQKC